MNIKNLGLTLSTKADVIVIGGGVSGLTTAYEGALNGLSVTLIEKDKCGDGSTNNCLGVLMPYRHIHSDRVRELAAFQRDSLWNYPAFIENLVKISGIDPEYEKKGRIQQIRTKLQLINSQEAVDYADKYWPSMVAGKSPMCLLSKAEAEALEPEIEFSEYGAMLCRNTAWVSPSKLVASLRAACLKLGVNIVENAAFNNFITENDKKTGDDKKIGVATASGMFFADTFVVAAGAHSSLIDDMCKVTPVKGQAMLMQYSKPIINHIVRGRGVFVVQLKNNQLYVGATKDHNAGFDLSITEQATDKILKNAEWILPILAECKIIKEFTGLRPACADGPVPQIGHLYDNVFALTGVGGIGVGLAPNAAKKVIKSILDYKKL